MKNIKIITFFIIVSLGLQLAIFLFLDWKADQLLNPHYRIDKEYIINESLTEAENYSLSYNNKFLACVLHNNLKIIDLINNRVFNLANNESSLIGYRWLPDRNGLIYFTQSVTNNLKVLNLFSLDFESENQIKPKLDRIISLDIDKILEIEISTYTNNLYILSTNSSNETELIKIDIMKNYNKFNGPGEIITKIKVSNKFGILFLESFEKDQRKTITMLNGSKRTLISDDPNIVLLECSDNLLYTGKLDEGYLTEIYLYKVDNTNKQIDYKNRLLIWQGKIPYKDIKSTSCIDGNLLLKNFNFLYIIEPNGNSKKMKSNNKIVPASTGLMYLELIEDELKTRYYWRSILISSSSRDKN
ncbi:MAG: hypothetical protein GX351_09360 [Peptococcaceae bacterium]|nr:hypothetical protein [Peptococcaceae bacterium]